MRHHHRRRHPEFGRKILPHGTLRVMLSYGGPAGNMLPVKGSPALVQPNVLSLPLPEDPRDLHMSQQEYEDLFVTLWSYDLLNEKSYEIDTSHERDIASMTEIIAVRIRDPWFGELNAVKRFDPVVSAMGREGMEHLARVLADELVDRRETRIARFLAALEVITDETTT